MRRPDPLSSPDSLSDHLRMPRDSHDARLPHVKLGLIDGGDFEDVERRGVEEVEGDEVQGPDQLMHPWEAAHVPQRGP